MLSPYAFNIVIIEPLFAVFPDRAPPAALLVMPTGNAVSVTIIIPPPPPD
jgi:hypothetical protein